MIVTWGESLRGVRALTRCDFDRRAGNIWEAQAREQIVLSNNAFLCRWSLRNHVGVWSELGSYVSICLTVSGPLLFCALLAKG